MKIIKDELIEIRDKYGDKRRTEIIPNAEEFNPEDFYADDEMVITISHMGILKGLRLLNSAGRTEVVREQKGSNKR